MCGTSSFDEEVPLFLKCHVLLCRGGPAFSILVSTNSNYFHFLHMWYLLVKRGGTRVVQILCTHLTRMISRFASCLHRFICCQFLYSPRVLRRFCFSFLVSTNSNYFHFLHMWHLLVKRGGTRVAQSLCTRLTRMFSRFASCFHRFTYCQFLYSPRVTGRSIFFQFLIQHILIHSISCMCGTSSFDEEVLEFLKCHVLLFRGGPIFSILVSTNSYYFHFLHMWYLLVKRGGTRVAQILCTRWTRMFSRFSYCFYRFTYCQFLYFPRVTRRSCFFNFS